MQVVEQVSVGIAQPGWLIVPHSPAGHAVRQPFGRQVPLLSQVWFAPQVPQVIVPPQPSGAVPHAAVPQAVALAVGVQPHTFGAPGLPPPQLSFAGVLGQVPQVRTGTGQPGWLIVPQLSPEGQAVWQPAGMQLPVEEHTGVAPVHVPQLTVPPQPSGAVPQTAVPQTCEAVLGTHLHTFETQLRPAAQLPCMLPQVTVPPQVSAIVPQLSAAGHAVSGAQTHLLLPLHAWPAGQVPQEAIVPPQPLSATVPHDAPSCEQVFGVHPH